MFFDKIKKILCSLFENDSKPRTSVNLYFMEQEKKRFERYVEEALKNKTISGRIYFMSAIASSEKFPSNNYEGFWDRCSREKYIAREIINNPKWLKIFSEKRVDLMLNELANNTTADMNYTIKLLSADKGQPTSEPIRLDSFDVQEYPLLHIDSTGKQVLFWSAVSEDPAFWANVLVEENTLLKLATEASLVDSLVRFSENL